jgi:cell fate (sporulation/competence/biofilm development) regulator YlbF (YheA/YmcA/DUF963 family)
MVYVYSDACPLPGLHLATANLDEAAEKLACLLIDTVEFQNYVRLSREVSLDSQISALQEKIHELQMSYFNTVDEDGNTVQSLQEQVESLALMKEFRQAEAAVHQLFGDVDRLVSQAAGIDFAANARSGCG